MTATFEHQKYLAERPDGHTAKGIPGDCYRTALAVVLDLRRDEVPHFALLEHDAETAARTWVRDRFPGWDIDWFPAVPWPIQWAKLGIEIGDMQRRAVATGRSPRGHWSHCVVIDTISGDLIHDPHPSGDGLLGAITSVDLIVPAYDPAPGRNS